MEIEFRVQILPNELRQTFYAGASFAGAAVLSIILLGVYANDIWPFLAAASSPLLWLCFSDYRKMLRQRRCPDVLRIEDDSFLYLKNGKKTLRVPYAAIGLVQYNQGVGLCLKRGVRIEVLDPSFQITSMRKKNCDLFFEWFGLPVKAGLDNIVHADQSNHLRSFYDGKGGD